MDTLCLQITILAVVQGIAEFLPISSSGHIVIAASLLSGIDQTSLDAAELNIVLHVGTLGSIIVVYFQRICMLLKSDRPLIWLVCLATVPAVVIGIPLKKYGDELLASPLLASCLLIITGLILLYGAKVSSSKAPSTSDETPLTLRRALTIGCAQALAILPGLSRSGLTITTAMALKLSPKRAATFSFLMAIPVIAGGGILEIIKLASESTNQTPVILLALGGTISFLVGVLSLQLLLRWLDRGRFHWFAWWCIPFGILSILLHLNA